jgi:hypothetical protein
VNVSKSSDPERLNNICVANVSDQARIVKHGSIYMNDREFSDIEIFEHSRKGISLFMLIYIINTYASSMYELKKIGKVFTSKFVGPRALVL